MFYFNIIFDFFQSQAPFSTKELFYFPKKRPYLFYNLMEKNMFQIKSADERGHTQIDWLDSFHSFSFGDYYDPHFMGYSVLRVLNDDLVAPSGGFATHPHANMEIVTVVIKGVLEHKDSLGSRYLIRPGEIQKMTAGSGIQHSEFNPSLQDPVHFLQIWIIPDEENIDPSYQQKSFEINEMANKLRLIVSPTGEKESLLIHQDAYLYQCQLLQDGNVRYEAHPDRALWIQVAEGAVSVNDNPLIAGDGLAVWNEQMVLEISGIDSQNNLILMDFPQSLQRTAS